MDIIVSAYNTVFYDRADPRVKNWLYLRTPWPLFFTLATYLLLIKLFLPIYMRNRKPYNLKTIIKWYNIGMIISNAVVTWGIMTSGWTTTFHFGCLPPDYSTTPEAMRMLRFLWWTMVLKLLELTETIFFILRKKDNQASFLHVYHHCSTLVVIWAGVKYIGGGMASFVPMVNNSVHVIMYSYYLLSAEGSPAVKGFLKKYKKWMTILQMMQFNIILIHSSQAFLPSCQVPLGISIIYFPSVIIIYYMFYDFFNKNFRNKEVSKHGLNNKVSKKMAKA